MARPKAPVGAPRQVPEDSEHRVRLIELRDRLADAIEEASARDLAPLAARYQAVLAELAGMSGEVSGDGFDDLLAARRRRRADTAS